LKPLQQRTRLEVPHHGDAVSVREDARVIDEFDAAEMIAGDVPAELAEVRLQLLCRGMPPPLRRRGIPLFQEIPIGDSEYHVTGRRDGDVE
jgi:hypothetical protein